MKLLALDVEGTIITGYDYDIMIGDRFKAIIDPELKDILLLFHQHDFKIVLATGTDGETLNYYAKMFQAADFDHMIAAYSPEKDEPYLSKEEKLAKYKVQFNVHANDIYFFDDAAPNVERAMTNGFYYSFVVSDNKPLVVQLKQLAERLRLNAISNSTVTPSLSTAGFFNNKLKYLELPEPVRQYLSSTTQAVRHQFYNHVSTADYWDQCLTESEQQSLLKHRMN